MSTMFQPGGGTPSPLTTKGDIWVFGTTDTKQAIGANNLVLIADSAQTTGMRWGSVTAAAALSPVLAVAAAATIIGNQMVEVTGAGGTFTLTFDVATGYSGQLIALKRTDNTPSRQVSVAVNGSTTVHLATQSESWLFASDGVNWQTLSHYAQTPMTAYGITVTSTGTSSPIYGVSAILTAYWWRNGSLAFHQIKFSQPAGGSGTTGNGTYLWPLAAGLIADSNLIGISTSVSSNLGQQVAPCFAIIAGTPQTGAAYMYDTTHMKLYEVGVGMIGSVNGGVTAQQEYTFTAQVPIVGWEA